MNILIVDDEYVTRMGLKSCLSEEKDFHIVGECANGKQALDIIKRNHKIDVILLDLNMPFMDGLQFLSQLDPFFPGKVVVLSGYDDLEHIKEAMKQGAYDYFHKPTMSPKKLISMLKEIKKKLREEEREPLMLSGSQSLEWIKHLIDQPSKEILEKHKNWFSSKPNSLYTILMSICDFYKRNITNYQVMKSLQEWKRDTEVCTEFLSWAEGKLLLIDFVETKSLLINREVIWGRCQSIQHYLKNDLGVVASFGISNLYSSPISLRDCLHQSEKALERAFFSGRGTIHFYDVEVFRERNPDKKDVTTEKIWEAYQELNKEKVQAAILTYFEEIKKVNQKKEFISLAIELLSELKVTIEKQGAHALKEVIVTEDILSMNYFNDIQDYTISVFERCIEWMGQIYNENYSPVVRQAVEYIRANFSKEFSLEQLAAVVQTNPSYLSRVFNQQTGYKIREFINQLRLDKAKELLMQHHLRVNEVALGVGYFNERYFSQIFKQETGYTPTEYRKMVKVNIMKGK